MLCSVLHKKRMVYPHTKISMRFECYSGIGNTLWCCKNVSCAGRHFLELGCLLSSSLNYALPCACQSVQLCIDLPLLSQHNAEDCCCLKVSWRQNKWLQLHSGGCMYHCWALVIYRFKTCACTMWILSFVFFCFFQSLFPYQYLVSWVCAGWSSSLMKVIKKRSADQNVRSPPQGDLNINCKFHMNPMIRCGESLSRTKGFVNKKCWPDSGAIWRVTGSTKSLEAIILRLRVAILNSKTRGQLYL